MASTLATTAKVFYSLSVSQQQQEQHKNNLSPSVSLLTSLVCAVGLSSTLLYAAFKRQQRDNTESITSVKVRDKTQRLVRYLSDQGNWTSYDESQERFVQEFPKIELHVHLDGSFDPDFLFRYMKSHPEVVTHCLPVNSPLPWDPPNCLPVRDLVESCQNAREYHQLCTCRGHRSLKAMLNCFEIFLPLVRRNLELLEQLAIDFCQRQFEQNTIYTEVRYSPFLLAESYDEHTSSSSEDDPKQQQQQEKMDPELVFQAITRGLRRGSEKFGITVNQILSAITWRPDWALPTLEMAKKHLNDYPCAVVGIDIASGEEHFDKQQFPNLFQPHYDMIQQAQRDAVPITIHAGESTEHALENVRRAVTEYGAQRIGHGYRMTQSPELMTELQRRNIHIEVCPTSSLETGGWVFDETKEKMWEEHPCLKMKEYNIPFSLSSDDPAVFHTSLAWQYRIALVKMKLSREDIVQTNLDAIQASFCSQEEKERLTAAVQSYAALKKVKVDVGDTATIQKHYALQHRYTPRSLSDSFTDRVYVSSSQYF